MLENNGGTEMFTDSNVLTIKKFENIYFFQKFHIESTKDKLKKQVQYVITSIKCKNKYEAKEKVNLENENNVSLTECFTLINLQEKVSNRNCKTVNIVIKIQDKNDTGCVKKLAWSLNFYFQMEHRIYVQKFIFTSLYSLFRKYKHLKISLCVALQLHQLFNVVTQRH